AKRAVAIIVIQNGTAVTEDEQIRETVVVVIADGNSHAEKSFGADARLLSDVCKRAVAVIAVERAAKRMRGVVNASGGAIHEVKVHQPVLVIINPGATRAHCLDQIFLTRGGIVMAEGDARAGRDVHEGDGKRGGCRDKRAGPGYARCQKRSAR